MPGTLEMSSERRRNEPVLGAAKIAEVCIPAAFSARPIFGRLVAARSPCGQHRLPVPYRRRKAGCYVATLGASCSHSSTRFGIQRAIFPQCGIGTSAVYFHEVDRTGPYRKNYGGNVNCVAYRSNLVTNDLLILMILIL